MSITRVSPNIDIEETHAGVRYILRNSGYEQSNLSLGLAFVLRIPLVAAGLAVWFLGQHFRQVSPLLTVFAGLFAAQMLFVARLPWSLFRQHLWQQLIARFGHGEIELHGEQLFSGNRVGRLRSGQRRAAGEIQSVVVYVHQDPSVPPAECEETVNGMPNGGDLHPPAVGNPDDLAVEGGAVPGFLNDEAAAEDQQRPEPTERLVLAIETATKSPWLLVDGLSRTETLTLAEDIYRDIRSAIRNPGVGPNGTPRSRRANGSNEIGWYGQPCVEGVEGSSQSRQARRHSQIGQSLVTPVHPNLARRRDDREIRPRFLPKK